MTKLLALTQILVGSTVLAIAGFLPIRQFGHPGEHHSVLVEAADIISSTTETEVEPLTQSRCARRVARGDNVMDSWGFTTHYTKNATLSPKACVDFIVQAGKECSAAVDAGSAVLTYRYVNGKKDESFGPISCQICENPTSDSDGITYADSLLNPTISDVTTVEDYDGAVKVTRELQIDNPMSSSGPLFGDRYMDRTEAIVTQLSGSDSAEDLKANMGKNFRVDGCCQASATIDRPKQAKCAKGYSQIPKAEAVQILSNCMKACKSSPLYIYTPGCKSQALESCNIPSYTFNITEAASNTLSGYTLTNSTSCLRRGNMISAQHEDDSVSSIRDAQNNVIYCWQRPTTGEGSPEKDAKQSSIATVAFDPKEDLLNTGGSTTSSDALLARSVSATVLLATLATALVGLL